MRRRTFLFASVTVACASATEPSPPDVSIEPQIVSKGDSNLRFTNNEKKTIRFTMHPGAMSTILFESLRVTLLARQKKNISLGQLTLPPGPQTLHVVCDLLNAEGQPAGPGPFLLLHIQY